MIKDYCLHWDFVTMCRSFASSCVGTNLDCYKQRNQDNIPKIISDIECGKLAEWGYYFILLKEGIICSPPDMRIYSAKQKSFDADLQSSDKRYHIKGQLDESASKFGDSWLFQKQDPLFTNGNIDDIVVGCRVKYAIGTSWNSYVNIIVMFEKPFTEVRQWGKPKSQRLQQEKTALYLQENL